MFSRDKYKLRGGIETNRDESQNDFKKTNKKRPIGKVFFSATTTQLVILV